MVEGAEVEAESAESILAKQLPVVRCERGYFPFMCRDPSAIHFHNLDLVRAHALSGMSMKELSVRVTFT